MNDFEMTLALIKKCSRNGNCLEGKLYNKQRYPLMRLRGSRKTVKISRLVLKLWSQESGDELCALHTCDNTKCLNPAHLYWGTHSQNIIDSVVRGRHRNANTRKTHCKHGHPFSGDNLRVQKTGNNIGRRYCRACEAIMRSKN